MPNSMEFYKLITGLLFLLASVAAFAGAEPAVPNNNYSILTLEKNVNPQNIMKVYTKLDSNCQPVIDNKTKRAFIGFYWLIDRQTYKPVHSLIESAIRERIVPEFIQQKSPTESTVFLRFGYLEEIGIDLSQIQIFVYTAKNETDGSCSAATFMSVGKQDQNTVIKIDSIYIESEKPSLFNMHPDVYSIRINGIDSNTGKKAVKVFNAQ